MGHPVDGRSQQARIAQNDLFFIEGRRVPVVGRLDIGIDLRADLRDLAEELDGDLLGFFLQIIVLQRSVLSVKGQCQRDLSGQAPARSVWTDST